MLKIKHSLSLNSKEFKQRVFTHQKDDLVITVSLKNNWPF